MLFHISKVRRRQTQKDAKQIPNGLLQLGSKFGHLWHEIGQSISTIQTSGHYLAIHDKYVCVYIYVYIYIYPYPYCILKCTYVIMYIYIYIYTRIMCV